MSNVFTDADAESLAQMLEKRAIPFGGMSLEQLDGFLSGVTVSPEAIAQADWMPRVWGKEPRWEGARDRDEHYAPILHLKAAVERRVKLGEEDFTDQDMPFIWVPEDGEAPPADDIPVGAEWADGFLEAVGFHEFEWGEWEAKDEWVTEALDLIQSLSGGEDIQEPGHEGRLAIVGQLPAVLHDLYAGGLERKTPKQPVRKDATPGRNDPCACGSGKKYKACHGKG
ncbi:UPF0149 family protein [Silanimonas sp.]|uniref:UPF0149 family protein n=1 Tax=Silanimonas sp. TaxID=1929290 RepID=UPI0022CA5A83|nr:UPF0149 family protein [Silanimonas sp.]MCZ8063603.1 UPF0149 family protein [Silanimonas sp.]